MLVDILQYDVLVAWGIVCLHWMKKQVSVPEKDRGRRRKRKREGERKRGRGRTEKNSLASEES